MELVWCHAESGDKSPSGVRVMTSITVHESLSSEHTVSSSVNPDSGHAIFAQPLIVDLNIRLGNLTGVMYPVLANRIIQFESRAKQVSWLLIKFTPRWPNYFYECVQPGVGLVSIVPNLLALSAEKL